MAVGAGCGEALLRPAQPLQRVAEGEEVVIARAGAADRDFKDLKADLEQALRGVHQPESKATRGQKHA